MSKVLRNTLALTVLISIAANAPGILMALGIGDGEGGPEKPTGAAAPPAENYAFDYGAGTSDADPVAWLDAYLDDSKMPASAWRHTWTDFDSQPAADTVSKYRRSPQWGPEGVMFAYERTYTKIGEGLVSDISSEPWSMGLYAADFGRGRFRAGGATPGRQQDGKGMQGETPPTAGGGEEPGGSPGENPGGEEPNTPPVDQPGPGTPPITDPPVSVPEPASLGLLALGLAGSLAAGRRRRGKVA